MSTPASTTSFNAGIPLRRDVWGVVSLSLLAVALRVLAKLRMHQFRWDDVLMCTAQALFIVGAIMITVGVENGFGRHVWDISPTSTARAIMFDYLGQTFGLSATCVGRVAFSIYLLGVLRAARWQKAILWSLIAAQVITNILSLLIMFLQCPGQGSAIWNRPGKQKCWDVRVQAYYAYFQGSFNTATDLYLAVFPTYVFWNLNMAFRTKVGLMILMGLGIFAMIASIVKTTQARVLAHPDTDPTVATVPMDRWLYIETALVITTSSIPCIRSLFTLKSKKESSNHSVAYELRPRHGVSASACCESRYRASKYAERARKQMTDDNSSEDNILSAEDLENDAAVQESGIVRRIDISVSVGPSEPGHLTAKG